MSSVIRLILRTVENFVQLLRSILLYVELGSLRMVIERFRLPAPVSETVFHLTSLLRRQSKCLNPALRLLSRSYP